MKKVVNVVATVENMLSYYSSSNFTVHYIGIDRGAYYLAKAGYQMQIAIGDFDSVSEEELDIIKRKSNKVVRLNAEKNCTDLEYALGVIDKLGYEAIYCYGCLGKRMDHTLVNIKLLFKYTNTILIDECNEISILKAGESEVINSANHYYAFISNQPTKITLKDFKYPVTDYVLMPLDTVCLSNEIIGKKGIVIVDKDIILIKSS